MTPDGHTLLAGNFWQIDVDEIAQYRRMPSDLSLSCHESVFFVLKNIFLHSTYYNGKEKGRHVIIPNVINPNHLWGKRNNPERNIPDIFGISLERPFPPHLA